MVHLATESESDAYLREHGVIGRRGRRRGEYPAYTEAGLFCKMRQHDLSNTEEAYITNTIAEQELAEFSECDMASFQRSAGVTVGQGEIWYLHRQGFTSVEIAEAIGLSASYARRVVRDTRIKLIVAMWLMPWWGWQMVYLSEVRRK